MKGPSLSAVLLVVVFLVAGCATSCPKPEAAPAFTNSDTRWFFGDTIKFERQGEAADIMDKVEGLQKRISKENNDPNVELSIYRLYVKADDPKKHDHIITEQRAKEFWNWYLGEFDTHVGRVKFTTQQ